MNLSVSICVAAASILMPTAILAQTPEPPSSVTSFVKQDFSYTSWKGDRGSDVARPDKGKGSEVYAPLSFGTTIDTIVGPVWQFAATSAYVRASQSTPGQAATYEGPVDTQLAASVTARGFQYVQPIAGVTVNVPTGESNLSGSKRFARMDPDLVPVGSFGEGLNANPYIGLTFAPTANWVITPTVGYAVRQKFTRDSDGKLVAEGIATEVDPGNVFTAALNTSARIGNLVVQGSGSVVSSSSVLNNGVEVGKQGLGFVSNVAVQIPLMPRVNLTLNGSWAFHLKNEVRDPLTGVLVDEPNNSNSHVLIGVIQPTFDLSDTLRLGVNYSLLYRSNNYYDLIDNQFVPQKTKHSVGASLDWAPAPQVILSLSGSRFWVSQDAGPSFITLQERSTANAVTSEQRTTVPALDFDGWTTGVSARVQF